MNFIVKLGFLLLPFNNFPKIEIYDNIFYLSFLWAIFFVITYSLKKLIEKKINLNKNIVISLIIFIFYIIFKNIISLTSIYFQEEILYIIKNILYYFVWCLTFFYLYDYLMYKEDSYKMKLVKLSLDSFFLTGVIEILNYKFHFYERGYTYAYSILRISPLSSESSYFNINICIPIFVYLYFWFDKKCKLFTKIKIIILILIIFLTFSSTGFFILIILGINFFIFYWKKIFVSYRFYIFLFIFYLLFGNILKNNLDNISLQTKKIYSYAMNKESGDYSSNIRNKVKNIYGKEIFKNNFFTGIGTTGIYRTSKMTKIGIENEINADAKNFYWTILAQEGIVGFLIYLLYFISIYFFLYKKKNTLKIYFLLGYTTFLILLNTYNNIWIQSFWIFQALILTYNKKLVKIK